jgi:hypothetical protein
VEMNVGDKDEIDITLVHREENDVIFLGGK